MNNSMVLFAPLLPGTPVEEWWGRFEALTDIERLAPWATARMLLYAKKNYCTTKDDWRQFKEDVATQRSCSTKVLENYCAVAQQWPEGEEYEELSFSHHAAVAGQESEERHYWLQQALEMQWSVDKLTMMIRGDVATQQAKQRELQNLLASGQWRVTTVTGGWVRLKNGNKELDCRISEWRVEQ